MTQRSRFAPTLGWMLESRWDYQTAPAVAGDFWRANRRLALWAALCRAYEAETQRQIILDPKDS